MHPSQDASPIQGRDLFAARGEVILVIDDSRVVTQHKPLHPQASEHDLHCCYLADGQVILMQYPGLHINHCCEPNSFIRTLAEARYLFALRNIKGEKRLPSITASMVIERPNGSATATARAAAR